MARKRSSYRKRISLDYTNLLAGVVGSEHGVSRAELRSETSRLREISRDLKGQRAEGGLAFMDLPYQDRLVREIEGYAGRLPSAMDNFVVIGIGGSALGNIMLQSALNHPEHNLLSKKERRGAPRMFCLDNVDPDRTASLLDNPARHRLGSGNEN